MIKNSYDAKGMKFGIVVLDNPEEYKREYKNKYNNLPSFNKYNDKRGNVLDYYGPAWDIVIRKKNYRIVEFEDIDGLSVKDVSDLLRNYLIDDNFIFLMYIEANLKSPNGSIIVERKPVYSMIIHKNEYRDNIPIESIINDKIVQFINDSEIDVNKETLRFFKCFLQRYCYGDAYKVHERITLNTKLNIKKNKQI